VDEGGGLEQDRAPIGLALRAVLSGAGSCSVTGGKPVNLHRGWDWRVERWIALKAPAACWGLDLQILD